jgi:hypothetical protein
LAGTVEASVLTVLSGAMNALGVAAALAEVVAPAALDVAAVEPEPPLELPQPASGRSAGVPTETPVRRIASRRELS